MNTKYNHLQYHSKHQYIYSTLCYICKKYNGKNNIRTQIQGNKQHFILKLQFLTIGTVSFSLKCATYFVYIIYIQVLNKLFSFHTTQRKISISNVAFFCKCCWLSEKKSKHMVWHVATLAVCQRQMSATELARFFIRDSFP